MRNSDRVAWLLAGCTFLLAATAHAQDTTGFAVDRFTPSAPGAGWLVLDDLSIPRRLQGALAIGGGYARNSFSVGDAHVVAYDARANVAGALGFAGLRLSFLLTSPIVVDGRSAYVQGAHYVAPSFDLAKSPDTLADTRIGLDGRLLGSENGPLRLGASVQLVVPSGARHDYLSDGTYRATARALLAGDVGRFSYAAHLGLHARPHYRGSELLFGAAFGVRLRDATQGISVVVGPEIFGETALRSGFERESTGVEALVTTRVEGPRMRLQPRFKLGSGGGLHARFGAPEWRIVAALELLAQP